jgi:hypothetical protein
MCFIRLRLASILLESPVASRHCGCGAGERERVRFAQQTPLLIKVGSAEWILRRSGMGICACAHVFLLRVLQGIWLAKAQKVDDPLLILDLEVSNCLYACVSMFHFPPSSCRGSTK